MATKLELLLADLAKLKPSNRVFVWAGFDIEPFSDDQLRQYLFTRDEFVAAVNGVPQPAPTTLSVRIVNATPYLRVRDAAVTGAKVGELHSGDVVDVWETQETAGWWKIAPSSAFSGGYISAAYTEKVT